MDEKTVPLKFNDVIIGDATITEDEEGLKVTGRLFDNDTAKAIFGDMTSHVSYGFDPDGVSFSAIEGEAL